MLGRKKKVEVKKPGLSRAVEKAARDFYEANGVRVIVISLQNDGSSTPYFYMGSQGGEVVDALDRVKRSIVVDHILPTVIGYDSPAAAK